MTIEKGLKLIKQLKEFCNERECDQCPFEDRNILVGHCLLKMDIPANFGIKQFELNAEDMRNNRK